MFLLCVQEGQTVLHLAALAGRTDTVEALLDRGCDPNIQDFVSSFFPNRYCIFKCLKVIFCKSVLPQVRIPLFLP